MEIIPCTKATYLMSRREEHGLSLSETFHLYLHLIVCKFCRRFLKQTRIIAKEIRRMTSGETLTAEEKQKMKESLTLA
jgi:hypothetical protein